MQWQHGTFEKLTNGSLVLKPIKVDGRQLYSDPCQYKTAVFTRYNTTEKFKVCRTYLPLTQPPFSHPLLPICSEGYADQLFQQQYEVSIDRYHKIQRLDLYQSDGAPLMPMYLAYSPPKMLPTTTLHPLVTATPAAGKVKRDFAPHEVLFKRMDGNVRADQWWWFGVLLTAGGGVMYWFF